MSPGIIACYTLGIIGALWFGCVLGHAIGEKSGYSRGFSFGRSLGWQDGYFQRLASDKSKRAKNGQFITTKGNGIM